MIKKLRNSVMADRIFLRNLERKIHELETERETMTDVAVSKLANGNYTSKQSGTYTKISDQYQHCLQFNSQFPYCGLPFRLDTYMGCFHDCKYCFANPFNRKLLAPFGAYSEEEHMIRPSNLETLFNAFKQAEDERIESPSKEVQCLKHRMVIHLGGISDPFQPLESQCQTTLKALEFLKERNYPVAISTKGILFLKKPWIKVMQDYPNLILQMSLIASDDDYLLKLEPNAPKASKRLAALKELGDMGIKTTCRIEPIMPGPSANNLESHIRNVGRCGVKHVSLAWARIDKDPEYVKRMNDALGCNILQLYDYASEFHSKLRAAPWYIAKESPNELRWAHDFGMTIGFANAPALFLGDTPCCCGIDLFGGEFKNVNRYNWFWSNWQLNENWKAGKRSEENLTFHFRDFDKLEVWRPASYGSVKKMKHHCRMRMLEDYMRRTWDKIMTGISYPDATMHIFDAGKDEDGHLTYRYGEKDDRFEKPITILDCK
jgi:DNA repair photolyase